MVLDILIVMVHLERFPKDWKDDWKSWISEDESRLPRQQYCED